MQDIYSIIFNTFSVSITYLEYLKFLCVKNVNVNSSPEKKKRNRKYTRPRPRTVFKSIIETMSQLFIIKRDVT